LGLVGAVSKIRGRQRGRGGEIQKEVGGLELEEPVAEAAVFPIGEVLFGDRTVVEVGGEDGFGFGKRVEPWEDGFGGESVVEFEVELFTDGMRESSDFADASVHKIYDFNFWREV